MGDVIKYQAALGSTMCVLHEVTEEHTPAVLANAFGPESMVMTDLISKHGLPIQIISLDTGRLPEATHELAHRVHQRYGPIVQMVGPDPDEVAGWTDKHGQNGFYESQEARRGCCEVRKTMPLRRVLAGKRAWLTGLRREHSLARSELAVSAWDSNYQLMKFNPMLEWTTEEVWGYIRDESVPYNSLFDKGFTSVGCAPCTRAVAPGEDSRAGRWWWERDSDRECGIHLNPDTGKFEPVAFPTNDTN